MTTSHQSPEKPQSGESPFRFERPIIRGGVVLLLTAVVLGSAVYLGHWLSEVAELVERQAKAWGRESLCPGTRGI